MFIKKPRFTSLYIAALILAIPSLSKAAWDWALHGKNLTWSTQQAQQGRAIAVDAQNNAYVLAQGKKSSDLGGDFEFDFEGDGYGAGSVLYKISPNGVIQ